MLSSVAFPALQHFSTLSHKRHDFRKRKVADYEMRVLIFPTILYETVFFIRIIERGMIIYVYWSPCEGPTNLIKFQ
jgi:hypothetical protein